MKPFFFWLMVLGAVPAFAEEPLREMRAAWIATVFNIDWPSRSGMTPNIQKKELSDMLDSLAALNFNAVIVQVKPASDALYESKLSPWSRYLTGTQGLSPGYDPLAYLIEESRKRGMEVHAWVNPFRVLSGEKYETLAQSHIARKHPEWIIEYGGRFYFDPGNPDVRARIQTEILEIVRNYDIDALHMDDYFYPYRVSNLPFGDGASYEKYGRGMSLGDWRRQNTEDFVQGTGAAIKKEKSHVRFGISPFGVWRNADTDPRGSQSKAGQTNFDDLFADILAWAEKGYVDYLIPQLYWDFDNKAAPFSVLSDWWSRAAGGKTKLYMGLGVYRLGETWAPDMLKKQVEYLRKDTNIGGAAFYSAKWIHNDTKGVKKTLAQLFPTPALMPAYDTNAPAPPVLTMKNSSLHWKAVPRAWNYAVYGAEKEGEERLLAVLPGALSYPVQENWTYRVSSLGRGHAESARASVAYAEKISDAPAIKPVPPEEVQAVAKPVKPSAPKPEAPRAEKPLPPSPAGVEPSKEPLPPKTPAEEPETKKIGGPEKPVKPQKPLSPKKEAPPVKKIEPELEEIFRLLEQLGGTNKEESR